MVLIDEKVVQLLNKIKDYFLFRIKTLNCAAERGKSVC